ncbi:hypothetical protein RB195_014546 [Necator americanus]|uniref:Trematode Eggshell Synthesis n=1 Tax=Necator americanus TaxID=51031 RepID=A0ABR1E0N2_NECAM
MPMSFHTFIFLLTVAASAASDYKYSYGHKKDHDSYGHDNHYKDGDYYGSSDKAHGHDHVVYSGGDKSSKSSYYGKLIDSGKHSKGEHQDKSSNKYSDSASDYGKDVKVKTKGYFDYKYVQPQYHVEKYHSDEKHVKKYGGDAYSKGAKEQEKGDYYSKGYDDYLKAHGDEKSHYVDKKYEDMDYGYKKDKYDSHHAEEVVRGCIKRLLEWALSE